MKNKRIERIVNRFKFDKSYDVVQLRNAVTSINCMAEFVKKNYPDKSADEIKQELFLKFVGLNYEYAQVGNPGGRYFQVSAARFLLDNKDFIKQECERIKDDPVSDDDIIYDLNLEENKKRLIKELVNYLKRNERDNLEKQHFELLRKDLNYRKKYS